MHKYNYRWNLKDTFFTKDKGKVFTCFAGGGGSTMGYKLAGFDVIGCNEIDKKMMEAYITNHNPKYSYLEPIQTFKNRTDLPSELYDLDILDGSFPCSSFSMSGNRETDWGVEKIFREGQESQVLDTLAFDFIDLGNKLQPKVIIGENVKGLLMGNAKKYVDQIHSELDNAGYYSRHWLLDSSVMGIPQKRERVFFIALRKDIATPFLTEVNLLDIMPGLRLEFNEPIIPFSEISDDEDLNIKEDTVISKWYDVTDNGYPFSQKHPQGYFFGDYKTHPDRPLNTICAESNHGGWHFNIKRMINNKETILGSSFPQDYDFCKNNPKYVCGMSVPPVMVANIADAVYNQWLKKL